MIQFLCYIVLLTNEIAFPSLCLSFGNVQMAENFYHLVGQEPGSCVTKITQNNAIGFSQQEKCEESSHSSLSESPKM